MTESRSWAACDERSKEETDCKGIQGHFWSGENILSVWPRWWWLHGYIHCTLINCTLDIGLVHCMVSYSSIKLTLKGTKDIESRPDPTEKSPPQEQSLLREKGKGKERLIAPQPGALVGALLLANAHSSRFLTGSISWPLPGARVVCYQVAYNSAQAPEFPLCSEGVPAQPPPLSPSRVQCTQQILGRQQSFLKMFERRKLRISWRQR